MSMALKFVGYIDLPKPSKPGGFIQFNA